MGNPFLDRMSKGIDTGRKSEKRVSKNMGARQHPASGAMRGAKSDAIARWVVGEDLDGSSPAWPTPSSGDVLYGWRRQGPYAIEQRMGLYSDGSVQGIDWRLRLQAVVEMRLGNERGNLVVKPLNMVPFPVV